MYDIVYHYTSPDGILCILNNKTLDLQIASILMTKASLYIHGPFEKAWKKISKERGDSDDNIKQVIDN